MNQRVTITQVADRHAEPHARAYSETRALVVRAGTLCEVLAGVLDVLPNESPRGRYVIEVDWPHV